MAAAIRVYCALRVTVGAPLRSFVSQSRAPAAALPPATAWQQTRHGSFFNKLTAEELWRGVLAETGAGARKGRGKRTKRKMKKDLNRGQMLGEGRGGFLWPGLNAPVVKDGVLQNMSRRGEAEQQELQADLVRQREEWDKKRKMKVKRERGWTGNSWGGISLGPPDPGPNGETYEDFDSRVIEVKTVFNMTAKEGRKRSISCLVAVGNGNGAAGFALGKAADRNTALRKAKNRAIHYLYYIDRFNDHTIYHNIESKYKRTTLRMKKQNQGAAAFRLWSSLPPGCHHSVQADGDPGHVLQSGRIHQLPEHHQGALHRISQSGNTPNSGQQEGAPRGGVPVPARPPPPGGGES
ncbi:28S ribosomal protein S5, mitochondrial isoform X2 [Pleuronectes platessa]|uniref:28S ribosomal protein S5, mitochondrial isoform X2 n=1 Tax=Pleuronectes platessa TaxID=8262 RepID=UPI00232A292F|nr:28S ribosomal protein S5, mitochondrial isoform X2 [Pleuronectes platessa]